MSWNFLLAIFILQFEPCLAHKSKNRYKDGSSVYVSYVNGESNSDLDKSPRINLGFNGSSQYFSFIMDTGSVGIVASADIFQPSPDAQNLGPGEQYYSSSGIIEKGTWWTATQEIYDADGRLMATANVPVLQVTEIVCASGARDCEPVMNPKGISVMGVGFARESNEQPRGFPSYNAFLNLQTVLQKDKMVPLPRKWINGYVVSSQGVSLGLTEKNTKKAGFVKLQPWYEYSTCELPEWHPAPMTLSVNGVKGDGNSLMDTGVGIAYMTPPANANVGTLVDCPNNTLDQCAADGNVIKVYLPDDKNPVAYYKFKIGQKDNPMQPDGVDVVSNGPKVFLNTSRHFLGGINFIYDNKNGYVGYIWNGNTSSKFGYVKPTKL